ncbi:MAG: GNAT family N-acetyltransferase [Prevotellaceae bacterium]|nr:GNAT family N-acetyltransferase [Prevotellaceae bacterium]
MDTKDIIVMYASEEHVRYAERICQMIYESALKRGTGIAKRTPEYITEKMNDGKAVVALDGNKIVGFSYIESWGHEQFVATSGLIVDPEYRGCGLATRIKQKTFDLARTRFPDAKLFSITTSLPVMKLNTRLGYKPVTFSELTDDDEFWKGCEGCCNYDILQRNDRIRCICTGMLYDPKND